MGEKARLRRELVRRCAAEWVVRLSERSCSPDLRAAFEAWRRTDPSHEAAFEREAAAWDALDRLRVFRKPGAAIDPDVMADWALRPKRSASVDRPARLKWAALAAGVTLTLGLAASLAVGTMASHAYATGIGERRVVVLSDGSRIELNTNSKVVVRYGRDARKVELVRGEAVFEIAKDARDFVVKANTTTFKASHSEMAVRLVGNIAAVAIWEGQVSAKAGIGGKATLLQSGAEAAMGPSGATVEYVSRGEIERTLAWRQGGIALNGQSLQEVAEEFNRYNTRRIVVADPTIAGLRLAGYFQTRDLPGFVAAVTRAFPVKAYDDPGGEIVLTGLD